MNDLSELSGYFGAFFNSDSLWVYQVFGVVFLTSLINFFIRRFINRLTHELTKTANLWDDAILEAARQPLRVLIWIIGLSVAMEIIEESSVSSIFANIQPFREMAIIALITWFVVRFIREAEQHIADPQRMVKPLDETTASALGKLLRASVVVTSLLVILQTLGYSISGVLAFGGIGGIAIGFAAKDLLSNFFGGLMIYLDRPFKVGDWIRSPDREIEGTVEDIGWRLTRIRTFDQRPLYVPNAVFATISLENPSRMTNRRIYETIGLRYQDTRQLGDIVQQVKAMLAQHPEIDSNRTLIVNFDKFSESSVDFFIYTFTKTTDWVYFHEVKQDVLLKVLEVVHNNGADCAFPTTTLDIPQEIEGKLHR
ncbi:MAG: mechanosensitive ion channel family protein [Pseudomonadales bacterium]|nr:mechanosensitive ion channel family protein [Pseudomonadales bacterium]